MTTVQARPHPCTFDPQLADCPPPKQARGHLACGIGDRGPLGRVLVAGEPGAGFVPQRLPQPGDTAIRRPGRGAFRATAPEAS